MTNTSNYLPIPPRAWSRVENRCSYDSSVKYENSDNIYDPFVYYKVAQINKGNVLQYKKNSSNLTKNQRYSQIAKGMWTNRTKTWATQSVTYTNPNTTSLKRVGYVEYPKNDITPGSPANPAGPYVPVGVLSDPFNCPNFNFKDGGILVCNAVENPCTGKIIQKTFQQNYYPTSDSDVPGPIQYLYWDPRLQTWYPRQRYTMNNSTDKWPVNYKLFQSAIHPNSPTLEIVSSTSNSVELSWTISNNTCYPVSKFSFFVNNTLYKTIANSTNYTTTLTGLYNGPYDIYITAILSGNTSPPSNIVVYNNEVVAKVSLNADNKTYSDGNTDLASQITDIASGNTSESIVSNVISRPLSDSGSINININTPAPTGGSGGGTGTGSGGSGTGSGTGTGSGGGSNLSLDSNSKVTFVVLNDKTLSSLVNGDGELHIPSTYVNNNSTQPFTIFNKDPENSLPIKSPNGSLIYSSMYAPNGVPMINIPPSSLATFTPSTNKAGESILYVTIS
jgi:hypothetical protein